MTGAAPGTVVLDPPAGPPRGDGSDDVPRRRAGAGRRTPTGYLLALPAVGALAVLFLWPVLRMVVTSLVDGAGGFSLDRYTSVLGDPFYLQMLWRTIWVSLLTTLASLVIAYPVALHMRQMSPRARGLLSLILLSPLLISVVVRTLGWVMLLSPTGVMNTVLSYVGLGPFNVLYTEAAVVIGMTQVYFGYMALSLMISVLAIPDHLLLAAADLGANRLRIFWHIVVPMTMPGVRAGCILVFALSASAYVTPAMLGDGREPVLAQRVYDSALFYADFEQAAAFATILLVMILLGMFLIGYLTRTPSERRGAVGGGR